MSLCGGVCFRFWCLPLFSELGCFVMIDCCLFIAFCFRLSLFDGVGLRLRLFVVIC